MDRLDAMRAFIAVADLESFAQAARRLRLSPAAVTRAVASLEEQCGATLVHRTTRSVRLTERGAVYREACRRILVEVEDADRQVRGEEAAPSGQLTVAAPLMFGRLHVLPVVQRLLSDHSGLSVRLTLSDRLIHLVEEGVDVAVRIGELADSALIATRVGSMRRVTVASPAYIAARGAPATPRELAVHDVIVFEGVGANSEWRFAGDVSVRLHPRFAVNSADAAIAATEAGFGVTRVLSYQAQAGLEAGRLRLVLEDHATPPVPVSVVYPARRVGSASVAAFVAAARDYFRANAITASQAQPG